MQRGEAQRGIENGTRFCSAGVQGRQESNPGLLELVDTDVEVLPAEVHPGDAPGVKSSIADLA